MPEPSPEHPSIHGQLSDSIDDWIEKAKTLPDAEINVPLLEAVRDGKMTAIEAGAERDRQLYAEEGAAEWRVRPLERPRKTRDGAAPCPPTPSPT